MILIVFDLQGPVFFLKGDGRFILEWLPEIFLLLYILIAGHTI